METHRIGEGEAHVGAGGHDSKALMWQGVKLFFADAGITTVAGFICGLVVGIVTFGTDQSKLLAMTSDIGIVVGTLVSVYIAYIAYKKYSQHQTLLLSLIVTACVISAADVLYAHYKDPTTNLLEALILIVVGVVAYLSGWYLSKSTDVKLPMLGKKWVTGFMWVGIVLEITNVLFAINKLIVH